MSGDMLWGRMTPEERARETARLDYEDRRQESAARLQYQVDLAQALLKSLMIGNGGALLALLTFIGNVGAGIDRLNIWWAFLFYGGGLVAVFVAFTGGFFSQHQFYFAAMQEAWNAQDAMLGKPPTRDISRSWKLGNLALFIAIIAAIASLAAFIAGSLFALAAIT